MNLPRENKNSVFYTLIVIIVVGTGVFGLLFAVGVEQTGFMMLPFAVVFTIFSLGLLYLSASKTVVTEDEITSKTMFSEKTLKWSEVARVSGSGHVVKLHNLDGDVTIPISPRLVGYQEIVDWVGAKRPDLFGQQSYSEIRGSLLNMLVQSLGGLSLVGLGAFPLYIGDYSQKMLFTFIAVAVIGFVVIGMAIFAPWSISIQGESIIVSYLFTRKTLTAREISSIYFGYSQTRRGRRNYYVQISKREGGAIRVSGLTPSLPVAYLVLKNWHKKNL